MRVELTQSAIGRWIVSYPKRMLIHQLAGPLAWSGSRWVKIDPAGFGLTVQVSNFETREEAARYAALHGFTVREGKEKPGKEPGL